MTYEEFLENIRQHVTELAGDEYTVRIMPVRRNNGVMLDSLMIMKPEDMMCPNIYLNSLYQWYRDGMSISGIAQRILAQYRSALPDDTLDISSLITRESVCRNAVCRVINTIRNQDILEEVPHREFLDLTQVYYVLIRNTVIGDGAVLIHRDHQKMWEIGDEELECAAQENTKRLLPPDLVNMADMIKELGEKLEDRTYSELDTDQVCRDSPMYVLTNRERQFGAYYISDTDILRQIARREEDDLYILPSSVHECMVLPARYGEDPEELGKMVREINRTQVDEEEFLSDSVYCYRAAEDCIEIAA